MAFAFSTLIPRGVGVLSWSSSLLARGAEVGMGMKLSVRSTVEVWCTELVIDDERVEGTRDGVALLDTLLRVELRSVNLRENDGKRLKFACDAVRGCLEGAPSLCHAQLRVVGSKVLVLWVVGLGDKALASVTKGFIACEALVYATMMSISRHT
jgi:hypothetical protein